jgi:UDP-N-acetyl-D-glucosamine dehydrogenase
VDLKKTVLDAAPELAEAIELRTATVGIVGLGYVGLPLLVAASTEGFPVIGVDLDRDRIRSLAQGRSYVVDVPDEDLAGLGQATYSHDHRVLGEAQVIIIAVPTPLKDAVPDLAMVKQACADVAGILAPDRLVILESTTYPGTTEEVVRPLLEVSGMTAGRDFFLAYSPERIDPGSSWGFKETPKIVSGIGERDTALAELFYRQLVVDVVRTPTPRDAEMAKLIENTFRQVNIALVNELAMLAPDLGVDIWAALEAAATKPFGYMPFWPGPGVGGHCIAIDPSYLSWRVGQRLGFGVGFVDHANGVNKRMPAYVASRIGEALNEVGKPLKGARILALGVAYKSGVNDIRESPALTVLERLARAGAVCSYHDPHVPRFQFLGRDLESLSLEPQTLANQDCVAILTPHPTVDYEAVIRCAPLVFDARGVTRRIVAENIVRL